MGAIVNPKTWVTGDTLTATLLNSINNTIYNEFNGNINDANIASGGVGTTSLATNAVTTAKITDANVTAVKLATNAVTNAKVANSAIDTAELAPLAVTGAKIAAATITSDKFAPDSHRVSVYNASSTAIGNFVASFTNIVYGTNNWDAGSHWASSKLTNTGSTYYWHITAVATFQSNSTGVREIGIFKNGNVVALGTLEANPSATSNTRLIATADILLGTTDFVNLRVKQTSGGNLNLQGGAEHTYMTAHRIVS